MFGSGASQDLKIGDIVEWSRWNSNVQQWEYHYGVLIEMKNEVKSNRMVSISRVIPLNNHGDELEFFTFSLRRVDSQRHTNV